MSSRTLRSAALLYDTKLAQRSTQVYTSQEAYDESPVVQSAKDDADINVIVKRFKITGQMPVNLRPPTYGDYSGIADFQSAMNVIRQAEETFGMLPANVRSRFGNDPQAFLQFCSDADNVAEMRKMGLAVPVVDDKMESRHVARDSGDSDERGNRSAAEAVGKRDGSRGESGEDSGGDKADAGRGAVSRSGRVK